MRIDFELQHLGKTYQCHRFVDGTNTLFQTIVVPGFGERKDSTEYGKDQAPTDSMEGIAKGIALEIVDMQTK